MKAKFLKFALTTMGFALSIALPAVAESGSHGQFTTAQGQDSRSGVEIRTARKGDVAQLYSLSPEGKLRRILHGTGRVCDVTDRVVDLKVSTHPQDRAVLYFVREEGMGFDGPNNGLYALANGPDTNGCPKATKTLLMKPVAKIDGKFKYGVVPHEDSNAVNFALSSDGLLVAWDDVRPILQMSGVVDYSFNTNYGRNGKPFSSYLVFALTANGRVIKIKGSDVKQMVVDEGPFSSLKEFKEKRGIE